MVMESVKSVQILDEATCISFRADALWDDLNTSAFPLLS